MRPVCLLSMLIILALVSPCLASPAVADASSLALPSQESIQRGVDVLDCSWLPGFHLDAPNGHVFTSVVFDDGNGPALYVAGSFATIGSTVANHVAKWDGTSWSALGSGADNDIFTLAVYDDGTGASLWAGGYFNSMGGQAARGVARWDGSSWSAVGDFAGVRVYDLTTYEQGGKNVLIAAGEFESIGGVAARSIAAWDGTSWTALGTGLESGSRLGIAFDVLSHGGNLYVGGDFTRAGGVLADSIAAWDGTSWSGIGFGSSTSLLHSSLAVYDHGAGPQLHIAGDQSVLKWNGADWQALGSPQNFDLFRILVHDTGSGPQLLAPGHDDLVPWTWRWTGDSWIDWSPATMLDVVTMARFDSGAGVQSYAGGLIRLGEQLTSLVRLDGVEWEPVFDTTSPHGRGFDGPVYDFEVFDDGSGPTLFAAGSFRVAGRLAVTGIARWSDGRWRPVGDGLKGAVYALAVYDSGSGPELFAGGSFSIGSTDAPNPRIAKWDGQSWSAVGMGFSDGHVRALAVYDVGDGPRLGAGGTFTSIGGLRSVGYAASWDGTAWSALGSGLPGDGLPARVYDLTAFEDVDGSYLVAAGSFSTAEVDPSSVAFWDGVAWELRSDGVTKDGRAVTTFDDGSGNALYVGGSMYDQIEWQTRATLSAWDAAGSGWSDRSPSSVERIQTLEVLDLGNGPALYAGGRLIDSATDESVVVRWDGAGWDAIRVGPSRVETLTAYDLPEGRALLMGGLSTVVGGQASSSIAGTVSCGSSLIFEAGFENGNSAEWSSTIP